MYGMGSTVPLGTVPLVTAVVADSRDQYVEDYRQFFDVVECECCWMCKEPVHPDHYTITFLILTWDTSHYMIQEAIGDAFKSFKSHMAKLIMSRFRPCLLFDSTYIAILKL